MSGAELFGGAAIAAALIAILLGIALCFFGYRIFRILLGVIGFVSGALGGLGLVTALVNEGVISPGGALPYQVLGVLLGGAIGAVLFIFVYFIGVFMLGAFSGLAIGYAIPLALDASEDIAIVVGVLLALAGGVLALVLQRPIIIIVTAISGALYIVAGFALLLAPRNDLSALQRRLEAQEATAILVSVAWFVLAVAGMAVQFLWTGKKKSRSGPAAAGAAAGMAAAGAVPQVVVQQYYVAPAQAQAAPAAPPVVIQGQPMAAPPPAMPVVVQPAPPAIPAPAYPYPPPLPAPEEEVQSFPTPAAAGSKFCPQCGQPVTHGTAFCTSCGAGVGHLWQ